MKLLIFSLLTIFSTSSFATASNDAKIREALAVSLIGATASCEQTLATKSGFSFDAISNLATVSTFVKSNAFSLEYNQEESLISIYYFRADGKYSINFHTNTSFNKVLSYTAKSSEVLSRVTFHGTYANPEFESKDILSNFNVIECSVENQNPTDLE